MQRNASQNFLSTRCTEFLLQDSQDYKNLSHTFITLIDIFQIKTELFVHSLSSFNQSIFNEFLLSFILEANLSFCLIKHDSFWKLLMLCWPDIQITHHTAFKTTLLQWYKMMWDEVLCDLSSSCKISLALDCWTSPNNYAFLAITGYFISDNWCYCEILLAFKSLYGKHTGVKLSDRLCYENSQFL